MYENEITLTCADSWFITLSSVFGKTSAMICMVTKSVQTSSISYKFLQEYRIGKLSKEGKNPVRCMHQQKDSWLKNIYWSLSELVEEIEKQTASFKVSGDRHPDREEHKHPR